MDFHVHTVLHINYPSYPGCPFSSQLFIQYYSELTVSPSLPITCLPQNAVTQHESLFMGNERRDLPGISSWVKANTQSSDTV